MKNMGRYFQGKRGRRVGLATLFLLVAAIVAGTASSQAAVQVSASLNATVFPIDRAAALSITVRGARSFQPQIPEVEGLLFQQRGQSTQLELINGAYSASVTTVYLVQARHEGKFTIPAIPIKIKGETLQTEPINFEVTAAHSASVSRPGQSGSSQQRD